MQRRLLKSGGGEIDLEHLVVQPAERRYGSPLLLLHDAWHAAWCWEQAMPDFARRGFEVHAISLRSHGTSTGPKINDCSIHDYSDDLRAALAVINPAPIVIGHGMGGYIVQYALADRAPIVAAVLLCSMPPRDGNFFVTRWLRRHPLAGARGLITANSLQLIHTPELARDAFFLPETPQADLERHFNRLQAESAQALTLMSRPLRRTPHSAHVLVIDAACDQLITEQEQRLTVERHRAELVTIPGAPHAIMLDPRWTMAADVIEQWVQRLSQL